MKKLFLNYLGTQSTFNAKVTDSALAKRMMPLSGLCALGRYGLACCGRHAEQHCAPGPGEKPVAFAAL